MIDFKNVSKVYDNGTKALLDVNLHIDKGEFVFVVGASGAGKSTFLKLMMREEVPSSGTIKIKDYNLGEMRKRKIPYLRRNMGIVFQDFRLIPTMTVYNNVAFAMRVVGAREKEIRKRVPYVINIVGLAAKADCYPNELSGGEQQRVALARALVNNADIIIADEPTGNVDPKMSLEIVEMLKRLNEAGTTVIMVTHAHDLVTRFDSRVIILEKGKVASDGYIKDGKLPEISTAHLNEDARDEVSARFSDSVEETTSSVSDSTSDEKPSDEFLDALMGDMDTYRVYLQKEETNDAESDKEGGVEE